jgi:hypothetical protein
MTQDELNLVLDALKFCHGGEPCGTAEAIVVVEKALAQEQEPVVRVICKSEGSAGPPRRFEAQTKQEPVAWRAPNWSNLHGEYGYRDFDDPVCGIDGKPSPNNEPLYTHSQRTWVGLTDDEIEELFQTAAGADEGVHIRFARAIESKLKELNT